MIRLLLFIALLPLSMSAQNFSTEVQLFKKLDSEKLPPQDAILFIGSSSFTMWKLLQKDFPDYPIINRAFGGSSLPDLIYHQDEIIYPYKPKQIVIYCGENDIANDTAVTGEIVLQRFKTLFFDIRNKLPKAQITYVSMKPSPSRYKSIKVVEAGNSLIKHFLKTQNATSFVNIFNKMLEKGRPNKTLFLEDMLHMNDNGYAIWIKAIKPKLIKK